MAWLAGIAGKAENLLNKIDKNTAAVLSKDKNELDVYHSSVNWSSIQNSSLENESSNNRNQYTSIADVSSSSSSLPSSSSSNQLINTEKKFNTFPNTPTSTPAKQQTYNEMLSPQFTDHKETIFVEEFGIINNDSSSCSANSKSSGQQYHQNLNTIVNVNEESLNSSQQSSNNNINEVIDMKGNFLLNNNDEILKIDTDTLEENVDNEIENGLLLSHSNDKHLIVMENDDNSNINNEKYLEEQNLFLNKEYTDNQKEIKLLKEKLQLKELEISQYIKQISDLQLACERYNLDLKTINKELEQHKARALKTLQDKERIIRELRGINNTTNGIDNSSSTILTQLREEYNDLQIENLRLSEQLKILQNELANANLKIEESNEKITTNNREAYELILIEKKKRIEAEEDAKLHLEANQRLKDELATHLTNWSTLQKQESEILRLKSQLSAASTPSSAVESRLTQTLVQKQNELENLTTEKTALRFQLEKIENEYRKLLGNRRNYNVNDTDDAKAKVPTLFTETPFDTGVTRRVKRAYTSLDAVSIRTGIFLRRYPLARIFVIIYIGFLQLWVFIILLLKSPDAH